MSNIEPSLMPGGTGWLSPHRDAYLGELDKLGYAARTISRHVAAVNAFIAQVDLRQVGAGEIDATVLAELRDAVPELRSTEEQRQRQWCIARFPDQLNPVLDNYNRVIKFCRSRLGHKPREELHILFLNKRQRLIRAETHQHGTIDHTPAYPHEICRRAIELDASSLILCHNHPSGDPTPSRADIDMTTRITTAAATLGISVLDHVIVAGASASAISLKAKGDI